MNLKLFVNIGFIAFHEFDELSCQQTHLKLYVRKHTLTSTGMYFGVMYPCTYTFYQCTNRERSGSVVECLTQDREAVGSSLTGVTALWSLSKTHLS